MEHNSASGLKKNEIYLADAASYIFGKLFVAATIGGLSNRIGLNGQVMGEVLSDVIYAFVLFRIVKVIKKRFTTDMFILMYFFIVSICFSLLFHPNNDIYVYKGLANLFLYCIPGYIIFRSIDDLSAFMNRLRYGIYVVFGLGTIYFFGYSLRNNIRGVTLYDMTFSYAYVVPVLFLIYWGMKQKSIIHCFLAAIGTVFILIQGSRGALLCIAAYITLNILKGSFKLIWKILFTFVMLIGSLLIWGSLTQIFMIFRTVLLKYNIRSRTVDSILYNSLGDSSGRDVLSKKAIELINDNSLLGYGLFGGRYTLGSYPHNIFLELLLQFGFVLGGILILFLVYLVLKTILSKKIDIQWRELGILMISYSLVYKCLSGSYLNDPDLLMTLGFLINGLKRGEGSHEKSFIDTGYNHSL